MRPDRPTVAVTGAGGFVGRNLVLRLRERGWPVHAIGRDTPPDQARQALAASDVVFHLAGANRPSDPADFMRVNRDYAAWVADVIAVGGPRPLVVASSSIAAEDDSAYGRSKRAGEDALLGLAVAGAAVVAVYRLPNLFGKWGRPNYNSVVATFCHNIARGLPIRIDDPAAPIDLLHIDRLIDQWLRLVETPPAVSGYIKPEGVHATTVGEIARLIGAFAAGRAEGRVEEVGSGLARELYATYVAALPEAAFSYPLVAHDDARGRFVEMVKTRASGQISFLTANPGVTRGGHYHHSKVEKFLVVHGEALFRFRHVLTGARHELRVSAATPIVVETVPGWTHDITNVGNEPMISMLWASELFDAGRPDTVMMAP